MIWICMFLHGQISVKHFGRERSVGDVKPFSVHHVRRHLMLICPIIDDMNFEAVSARFLHTQETISFCNQWIICGEILWDSLNILIPNRISPSGFSNHWFLPETVVAMMVIKWWLCVSIISTCISWHSFVKKSFPLLAHTYLSNLIHSSS